MLDTLREVETPEGIRLELRAAGAVPRALAWLLDVAIRLAVLMIAAMMFTVIGEAGQGLYLIALFLIYWAYPIFFEAMRHGRTPGKAALGLRVIRNDGAPIGWIASITRNFLRVVDMLPFLYGFGLVSSLIDPWGRRLGDLVAGTIVVHEPPPRRRAVIESSQPTPVPIALTQHEQALLISYAERAPLLTRERQQELAQLLRDLTSADGEIARQRLIDHAAWLVGRNHYSEPGKS